MQWQRTGLIRERMEGWAVVGRAPQGKARVLAPSQKQHFRWYPTPKNANISHVALVWRWGQTRFPLVRNREEQSW